MDSPYLNLFINFNGKQTTSALSGRTKLLTRCTTGVVPLSLVFRIVGVCLPSMISLWNDNYCRFVGRNLEQAREWN